MTASRSPKFIGAKLGLASALALGALPMVSTEALAGPVASSDTLQIGSARTFAFAEGGTVPYSVTEGPVLLNDGATFAVTNLTATIALLDPGTTAISDIVTATIFCGEGFSNGSCAGSATLRVTLTSDG